MNRQASGPIRDAAMGHDPEKWVAVFRQDHARTPRRRAEHDL